MNNTGLPHGIEFDKFVNYNLKVWFPHLCNISSNAKIGGGTIIHAFCAIHDQVEIGENCKIESGAFIPNGVIIGDNVFIGPGVIFTNDPGLNGSFEKTIIGTGAKIGAGAMILAGVIIGENSKIGMGSVVLDNVPEGELWGGNPARCLKTKRR